ncbi:acyl carrier protein [Streptomyces sp. INA 01156]
MSARVTMNDLKRALEEGSGVDEGVNLDTDLETMAFSELGYDSLAVLETGLRLGRENDIELDDSVFADLDTPSRCWTRSTRPSRVRRRHREPPPSRPGHRWFQRHRKVRRAAPGLGRAQCHDLRP